jgi:DNA helicase-4
MAGTWVGPGWKLQFHERSLSIATPTSDIDLPAERTADVRLERSWFRWFLYIDRAHRLRLRGLRRVTAHAIRLELRRLGLSDTISAAVDWQRALRHTLADATRQQRWIPRERVDELVRLQPTQGLGAAFPAAKVRSLLSPEEHDALEALTLDVRELTATQNERTLGAELRDQRQFLDRIERSPLTEEQARAVICFDSRVNLLAAAGSGKTSVMVARAAYAVARGFVRPDKVLLMAFNRAAAAELQERVEERFAAAGIPSEGVRATTFHAFGLELIGRATGRKPRLAPWLDASREMTVLEEIIDALRDKDASFRYKWDLFRLMLAPAPEELDSGTPATQDPAKERPEFRTFNGEIVRSAGERIIADWLFINGVNYVYEQPYSINVADATHSQYHPDFYYPDVDVWHEHWALDRDGKPCSGFDGYAESMAWKKALHARHGTRLVESTWHDVMFADGLRQLQQDLTAQGLAFEWDAGREIPSDVKPLQFADLARLMRTFMTHVKSNSLDEAAIDARLNGDRSWLRSYRTRLFLELYWPIHRAWNQRLREQNLVDFEDMLVLAADHLEAGNVDPGYELVLVDEFQDVSQARARVIRGLLQHPNRYLLAVGDDWQAINRFAGADSSIIKNFDQWFGAGTPLVLSTTFRCPQTICDVGSRFVMRNPSQLKKSVRSAQGASGPPVTLLRTDDIKASVADYLIALSGAVADDATEPATGRKLSVTMLGRYRFDKDIMPEEAPANLDLDFRTVHGSKGLEADYIVIPRLTSGRYAFPSEMADDPVLDLAMASPDRFPHAEERRLLYVALTRARRQVTVLTERGKESVFVAELLRDQGVVLREHTHGTREFSQVCEACGVGTMVRRTGPYGDFFGCDRFPLCRYKCSLPEPTEQLAFEDANRDQLVRRADGATREAKREEVDCPIPLAGPADRDKDGTHDEHDGLVRAPPPRLHWVWVGTLLPVLILGAYAFSRDPSALSDLSKLLQSWGPPRGDTMNSGHRERMFVNTAILNVRSAPSMEGEIVRQVTSGQPVRLLGESGNWRRIALDDGSEAIGWVYGPFLSATPSGSP